MMAEFVRSNFIEGIGYTDISVVRFKYTWQIRNFSLCLQKTGSPLISPKFPIGDIESGLKWNLKVFPKGANNSCKENVSVFLVIDPNSIKGEAVPTNIKFSILNGRLKEINIREVQRRFEKVVSDGHDWGFQNFVSQKFLLSTANNALPGDTLSIRCEIVAGSDQLHQTATPTVILFNNFNLALDDPEFSDMTVSVKGRDFAVHKVILATRSPVFKAMFHANMKENENQRVEIEDLDEKVVEGLLRFMYTGRVSNLEEIAEGLFVAADKYELTSLKATCERELSKTLSIPNAAYIFTLADLHGVSQLKSRTKWFIHNHILDVGKTEAWKTMVLNYPRLAIDVFSTQ